MTIIEILVNKFFMVILLFIRPLFFGRSTGEQYSCLLSQAKL